jgi:membrane fusion protein, multidrug efflux system
MKRRMIITLSVLTLAAAGLLSACGDKHANSAPQPSDKEGGNAVTVSVTEVQPEDFAEVLQLTGTVASFDDVKVPTDEGGRVLQWMLPRGASVRKGQVLVVLDSAIARATYDAAVAQYNIAQTNYEKQKRVYEQQGISELQLKTLQYQRDAAKAQMDMSRERLDRTKVKSPINGVLNERYVENGEMSAPGMPIAHVVNIGNLKIEAGVPERYAGNFRTGDKVTFTVDAVPGHEFHGTVGFVAAAVNKDNRTIPIEVLVSGAGGKLKPEMIASVNIVLTASRNVIAIEGDYISKTNIDEFSVYVVEDAVARERKITIGGSSRGKVLISSGLKAGDKLITLGYQNVADGQPVFVKN